MYEKIKAEIERRRTEFINKAGQTNLHDAEVIRRAVISDCNDILNLIESLEKEQPQEYVLQKSNRTTYYYKVIGKEGNASVIGEKPEGTYRELTQAESNFLNTVEVKED